MTSGVLNAQSAKIYLLTVGTAIHQVLPLVSIFIARTVGLILLLLGGTEMKEQINFVLKDIFF
ncbi:MAG: hypothetical protein ACP5RE_03835, partial [Candidatus Acidifodinimicrobium sp.]